MSAAAARLHSPSDRRQELIDLCQAARWGDFSRRMTHLDPEDPDTPLYEALNDLLNLLEASMRESAAALAASVDGRFHRRFLEQGMPGAFLQMARQTNQSMERMAERAASVAAMKEERAELADGFRDGVSAMAATLASAATELDATSTTMASISQESVNQAERCGETAESATANTQAVAAATEQLAASISEIAKQSAASAQATSKAADAAKAAAEVMKQITEAADNVSSIVSLISDVADQTNLLALNAAIEAARAGDEGRGFGVVASEVKSLAKQTAQATEDIARRIQVMRSTANHGVESIENINAALTELEGFASTVSAAIYEQEAATQHIAQNAEGATSAAREVCSELGMIAENARSALKGAEDIQAASREISVQAERLTLEVDTFLRKMCAGDTP